MTALPAEFTTELAERVAFPLEGARLDLVAALALLPSPVERENVVVARALLRNVQAAVVRVHEVIQHLCGRVVASTTFVLGTRILIVDDDTALLNTFRRALGGYDLVAIRSPREALARIAAGERFGFILADLFMEEMTGDLLLTEIRRIAPEQAERFVFVTAGALTPEANAALSAAGRPILIKPFGVKMLWNLLGGLKNPPTA